MNPLIAIQMALAGNAPLVGVSSYKTNTVMVDMRNIVHKPGGFSPVIAVAAQSEQGYEGSALSSSSYHYYDGSNAKQCMFPAVPVSK